MTRFILRRVDVKIDRGHSPCAFYWNGRWFPVSRVSEVWKDTGAWWEGEAEKTFYRVEADTGTLYELYMDNATREWFLYRIYD